MFGAGWGWFLDIFRTPSLTFSLPSPCIGNVGQFICFLHAHPDLTPCRRQRKSCKSRTSRALITQITLPHVTPGAIGSGGSCLARAASAGLGPPNLGVRRSQSGPTYRSGSHTLVS